MADDHQITADDNSLQPVVFPDVQGSNSETLEVFRVAEQGKQRQLVHGNGLPAEPSTRALDPLPEALTAFLSLVNLLN